MAQLLTVSFLGAALTAAAGPLLTSVEERAALTDSSPLEFSRQPDSAVPPLHLANGTILGTGFGNRFPTPELLVGANVSVNGTTMYMMTNASGNFSFDLPPGTYNLTGNKSGYRDGYASNVVVTDGNVTKPDLFLTTPPVTLKFRAVDNASSAPINGAQLRFNNANVTGPCDPAGCVTNSTGNVTYGPIFSGNTTETFEFRAAGYFDGQNSIDVSPGARNTTIRLDMRPVPNPGMITGYARESGFPVAIPGAMITVNGTTKMNNTDASGRYTITLDPGTYNLTFTKTGYNPSYVNGVVVMAGQTTWANGTMTRENGWIRVLVRDNLTKAPIANAIVDVDEFLYFPCTPTACITPANGTVFIGPIRVGTWTLNATAGGYYPKNQSTTVTLNNITSATMDLDKRPPPPMGWIAGTVADFLTPIAGATVRVNQTGGTATTDASGEFNISAPPGTYSLEVTKTPYVTAYKEGVIVSDRKTTTVSIRMKPHTGILVVTVIDKDTGQPIGTAFVGLKEFLFVPCVPIGCLTGADGMVTIGPVDVGTWTLNVTGIGYKPSNKSVTVAAASRTQVTMVLEWAGGAKPGQSIAKGKVVDASSGAGIAGAKVSFVLAGATKATATTKTDGSFDPVVLDPGTYAYSASASGYDTYTDTQVVAAEMEYTLTIPLRQAVGDPLGMGGLGWIIIGLILVLVVVGIVAAVAVSRKKKKAGEAGQQELPPAAAQYSQSQPSQYDQRQPYQYGEQPPPPER